MARPSNHERSFCHGGRRSLGFNAHRAFQRDWNNVEVMFLSHKALSICFTEVACGRIPETDLEQHVPPSQARMSHLQRGNFFTIPTCIEDVFKLDW